MGENDWFSVVKLESTWGGDFSINRTTYFIWNAYQKDANNTDAFYRNNYYTIEQIKENMIAFYYAVKDNKNHIEDEGLKLDDAVSETSNINEFFEKFDEKSRTLFMLASNAKTKSVSEFMNMHTKEELKTYIKKIKLSSWGGYMDIKYQMRQLVNVLSKKRPQIKDADIVVSFYTDIYLLALKKWLIKENL